MCEERLQATYDVCYPADIGAWEHAVVNFREGYILPNIGRYIG